MSEDAKSSINAAIAMGAEIETGEHWIIKGTGGNISKNCKSIDVGNSGTSLRIFTAIATLTNHEIKFDGDSSIRTRPMEPLLIALEKLGVTILSSTSGKCPFVIRGPLRGGQTTVKGISSQFLTALLIASPLAVKDIEIEVINLNEKPYVEITLDWLDRLGIKYEHKGLEWFKIYGCQNYGAFERIIPADFSSAAFPLCAASITGSEILIKGLDFSDKQGDKEIFTYFERMGLKFKHTGEGIKILGGNLKGIDIDMNSTPDALPAMAVAACFAEGTTRLLNVPQARLKECDRIAAVARELGKMGAKIEELEDGLVIHQSTLIGAEVHGYNDHRMVMSLSIAGLASKGETTVDTAESVSVTYPGFNEDLKKLGAFIKIIE